MVLAVIAAAAPAAAAAVPSRPLRAKLFTTRIPAAWRAVAFADLSGARVYRIWTPRSHFDDDGFPLPGSAAVFVTVLTPGQFRGVYGADLPRVPDDQFDAFSSPRDATEDVTLFDPHRAALGREPALTLTFGFRFREAFQVETDLVARHAGRVVVVSVATTPDRAGAAGNALRTITRGWRWRAAPKGRAATPERGVRYLGATSQGEVVAIERSGANRVTYAFVVFPRCPVVTIPAQADGSTARLGAAGTFTDGFTVSSDPGPDAAPVIGGRPHRLLLLEKVAIAGRIGTGLATGTLRDGVGVFDRDLFPAPGALLDSCDPGTLTWRARRY
jgi:hypothetical protein